MPKFRVEIRVANFRTVMDDDEVVLGVFTTRFVEAADVAGAKTAAASSIRGSERLRLGALNAPDDPVRIHVEDVQRLDDAVEFPVESGFVFFPDDDAP